MVRLEPEMGRVTVTDAKRTRERSVHRNAVRWHNCLYYSCTRLCPAELPFLPLRMPLTDMRISVAMDIWDRPVLYVWSSMGSLRVWLHDGGSRDRQLAARAAVMHADTVFALYYVVVDRPLGRCALCSDYLRNIRP